MSIFSYIYVPRTRINFAGIPHIWYTSTNMFADVVTSIPARVVSRLKYDVWSKLIIVFNGCYAANLKHGKNYFYICVSISGIKFHDYDF